MAQSKVINARISLRQSPYWVLTLRSDRQVEMLMNHCNQTNSVRFCLIGPWEVSSEGERHCHAFVQYDKSRRHHWAGFFCQELKNLWLDELTVCNGGTILQAKLDYLIYCIKEGDPQYTKGIIPPSVKLHMDTRNQPEEVLCTQESDEEDEEIRRPAKKDKIIIDDSESEDDEQFIERTRKFAKKAAQELGYKDYYEQMEAQCKIVKTSEIAPKKGRPKGQTGVTAPKRTKTSDIIRSKIMAGESRIKLLREYPHMGLVIKQCLELHKTKYEASDCMYIYGPTGSGKTTTCKRVFDYFKRAFGINYYAKMGGLSKFFDGYDWQPIILIDDPVTPDANQNQDQIQMFKTIINEHQRLIEVKGGSMPLDSGLIVITANVTPSGMANACGMDCSEAIYRRLTKQPGAFYVRAQDRERITKQLIKIVGQRFDLNVDVEAAYDQLEKPRETIYDLTYWYGNRAQPAKRKRQATIDFIEVQSDKSVSSEEELSDWENESIPDTQLSPISRHKRWAKKQM